MLFAEIKALQSNLTLEQILAKEASLRKQVYDFSFIPVSKCLCWGFGPTLGTVLYQVEEMEDKLTKMRGGVTLVSPEERKAVEAMYTDTISQWRRRKRMFKDVWDAITENSPKNLKDFKVL